MSFPSNSTAKMQRQINTKNAVLKKKEKKENKECKQILQ